MADYQIEATIEKLKLNGENLEIQLKGCGKYCFEKTRNEKEKAKEEDKKYFNIFEAVCNPENSKLIKQENLIQINIPNNELVTQHLLGHAFAEKKKFKFELKESEKNGKTIYTIAAISHVSN